MIGGQTMWAIGRSVEASLGGGSDTRRRTLVIASTATPDRYDDIVDQATWKLDRYRQNPVVAWGHDYTLPPVGRSVMVEVQGGALVAEIEWDEGEHNPLGRTVAEQYRTGFLSAVSVRFQPDRRVLRSELPADDPRKSRRGWLYEDNELLEISAVAIPANPEALAAKGLPPDALAAQIRRLLAEDDAMIAELQRALDRAALTREARALDALFGR